MLKGRQGEQDERTPAVHTGSGQRGAGTKGRRREVDANSRQRTGGGTRLTLWHKIDRRFISMGVAGWHICFDVLDRLLSGTPIGRITGSDAMKFEGWQRLTAEYAKQFEVETPGSPRSPGTK